jgi:glutamine cyclotransferase
VSITKNNVGLADTFSTDINNHNELFCHDSDDGISIFKKGETTNAHENRTDSCWNNNILTEFYCLDNGQIAKFVSACEYSCVDGACVNITGWNLSNAFYSTNDFDYSAQETGAKHIYFKPDGTVMYLVGEISLKILQYNLSRPWDITSAVYNDIYYDIADGGTINPQINDPKGLVFKADGTKLYLANSWEGGADADNIFAYTLSTPWDLSTISYTGDFYDFSEQNINVHSLFLKNDGTKMYLADYGLDGTGSPQIRQYSLSTPWDISTASYDNISLNCSAEIPNRLESFFIKDDGTTLFAVTRADSTKIFQYNLSTPWDISTGNYTGHYLDYNTEPLTTGEQARGIFVKPGGTKLYLINNYHNKIHQITLADEWNLNNGFYHNYYNLSSQTTDAAGISFNNNGTKMYINEYAGRIYQYSLSLAYDIRSAVDDNISYDFSATEANQRGLAFNDSGTKMYIIGSQTDRVYEIDLNTAWDLSTANYTMGHEFNVNPQTGNYPLGLAFNLNGTRMYINNNNETVYQYNLNIAWNLTSAVYSNNYFNYSGQDNSARGIAMNPTGNKFYALGDANDHIYQYNLNVPNNISTADYNGVAVDTTQNTATIYETDPRGIIFKNDGKKLYLTGKNKVWQIDIF